MIKKNKITAFVGAAAIFAVAGSFVFFSHKLIPSSVSKENHAKSEDNIQVIDNQKVVHKIQLNSNKSQPVQKGEDYQDTYSKLNNNSEYADINVRLTEINSRRPALNMTAEELVKVMSNDFAWEGAANNNASPEKEPVTDADGRVFIQFNPKKIETLVPGDTLKLRLEQLNSEFNLVVDKIEMHGDGNISWRGHLSEFEAENYASFTQSDSMTVAGITTPDGSFTLESRGTDGWVIDSGALFKIPEGHETDVVVPEGLVYEEKGGYVVR